MSHMDPFANIVAPLPLSEGILKALGVALRLSPIVSSCIWVYVLVWELNRRGWIKKILDTRPCQWIAVRIYFPYVIGWSVKAFIGLLGYILWFWMILLAKHAQLCFWGALPCGPCPVTISQLFLPIQTLMVGFNLLDYYFETSVADMEQRTRVVVFQPGQAVVNGGVGLIGNAAGNNGGAAMNGSGDATTVKRQ